jgi:hypothetical protein
LIFDWWGEIWKSSQQPINKLGRVSAELLGIKDELGIKASGIKAWNKGLE